MAYDTPKWWPTILRNMQYNLAIIVSNRDRPLSKGSVDDMRQMALKKVHNVKNSSEWSKFLRFYLYFCHAVLMNC